jgi:MYXO-CTERM domain-containing protein
MLRKLSRAALACGAVLLGAGRVDAEPGSPPPPLVTSTGLPGRRITVDTPVTAIAPIRGSATSAQVAPAAPADAAASMLYLERCRAGCKVHLGSNDARTNTSMIPMRAESIVGEFASANGSTGSAADDDWAQLVQCVKEVYSPYNVVVTDVRPASGQVYHEAIVAGRPEDIGLAGDILGVAPLASDCRPIDNVISFSFASNHPPQGYVLNLCWTAAQESAHAYGLDHEYSFSGNRSACNDPMTYRNDCGGEKFFRNEAATCGENEPRTCKCGMSQNSHHKLLSVFGPGTPITARPSIDLTVPAASGGMLGRAVSAHADAQRGVARVEVYFNGFKWGEAPGVKFLLAGQPSATYNIPVPTALPDSVVDVKTIAFDDLEISTESTMVTVTKGAPCTTADTCATGQKCEAGKCFWDPPTGEVGDSCAYPQFCKSLVCQGFGIQPICTQACTPGVEGGCPSGFSCTTSDTGGVCFFAEDSGGCCSVDRSGEAWLVHGGLAAAVVGFLARRRRRGTPAR